MKYFFLIYAIVAALFIGLMPKRGETFNDPPFHLFPDMDEQDRIDAQEPDQFFSDGMGAREPVERTHPRGFLADGERSQGGIPEYEFGGGTSYYYTGGIDGYFGTGMPEELELTEENVDGFIRRGQELYEVNCRPCHGRSGDGQGIASQFGVPGVANLALEIYGGEQYPDGRLYDVITNGAGNMGSYKHNIPVRGRWAVVAYVRALQEAREAPLSEESIQTALEQARAAGEVQ